MKFFKKRGIPQGPTRTEALRAIPERAPSVCWRVQDDGDILIEYPLAIRPFFLQLAARFSKEKEVVAPTRKLQLDRLGSSVWQLVDGRKDVGTIITEFAAASGFTLQEAEQSVTAFFRQLGRRGLIFLRQETEDRRQETG